MTNSTRAWVAVICAVLSGCALLGKSDPHVPRYFTPEYEGSTGSPPAKLAVKLHLGQVAAWSHLRERMVARNAGPEVIFSEELRWTEPPEVYLRRALARALFVERGVVQVMSGQVATLDVELIAFEQLEAPPRVRLQALIVLHDERIGLLEETVTVERPVTLASEVDAQLAVVNALSLALREGVGQISDKVLAKLLVAEAAAR
jgi:hypothetical protein